MKRLLLMCCVAAIAAVLVVTGLMYGDKPFAKLDATDVASAKLLILPPQKEVVIQDEKNLSELVDILNTIKTYDTSDSGEDYVGQLVRFTLTLKDGSQVSVGAYNPFLYINEVCYKTRYGACQRLNAFGNRLLRSLN